MVRTLDGNGNGKLRYRCEPKEQSLLIDEIEGSFRKKTFFGGEKSLRSFSFFMLKPLGKRYHFH